MKEFPICASCIGMDFQSPVLSSNEKIPAWLKTKNYVKDFVRHFKTFRTMHKKKCTVQINLNVGETHKNQYVLYWAALPTNNETVIEDAKTAYGKFENSGVGKVDQHGNVSFCIQCPQNYRTTVDGKKKEEIFYRHVHFCFQDGTKKAWDTSHIYTKVVTCNVQLNFKNPKSQHYFRTNDQILINTLPKKMFQQNHIPGSIHLDSSMVKKMTKSDLYSFFQKIINQKENGEFVHETLRHALLQKKMKWYAVPIILYCQNDTCNASDRCLEELYKKQMVNIKIYKSGMDDFEKRFKKK